MNQNDEDSDGLPGDEPRKNTLLKSKAEWEQMAKQNYEFFYKLPSGSASLEEIANSPAGVAGWAKWNPEDGQMNTPNQKKEEESQDNYKSVQDQLKKFGNKIKVQTESQIRLNEYSHLFKYKIYDGYRP